MRMRWCLGMTLFCGLLLLSPEKMLAPQPDIDSRKDPRLWRLQQFFRQYACPIDALSADFLRAADRHGIDWRLLPAIAFVESSGGKFHRHNNIFGWGNGDIRFRSVKEGIRTVADRLANSDHYRGKEVDEILFTYNPRARYTNAVKEVMKEIGPEVLLRDAI